MDKNDIFVGIVIIIAIIIFLVYYKSNNKTDYFNALTDNMITTLDNDIALCFSGETNPSFEIFTMMNQEFIQQNQTEILEKMKEITIPGIVFMSRYLRLYSIDYICKNTNSYQKIQNLLQLFVIQINQLIKLFNQVYKMISNNIPNPIFNDVDLLKQIICLVNNKVNFDDRNILSDYDSIEYPQSISARILDTYNIFIFSQEIYNMILNLSQNKPIDNCTNLNLSTSRSILPVYRMHPNGDLKSCRISEYSIPIPTPNNNLSQDVIRQMTKQSIINKMQLIVDNLTQTQSSSTSSSSSSSQTTVDAPTSNNNPNLNRQYTNDLYDNDANYNDNSYALTDTNFSLFGASGISGTSDTTNLSSPYFDAPGTTSSLSAYDYSSNSSIYYSMPIGMQNTNPNLNNYNYGYSTNGGFQYIYPQNNSITHRHRNNHRHRNVFMNNDFNIELQNDKGYNNFFKPSIYIDV
jgi:hypothetical protein